MSCRVALAGRGSWLGRRLARPHAAGLVLALVFAGGVPCCAVAQAADDPSATPTTPREIIDRLIAQPLDGEDRAVAPRQHGEAAATAATDTQGPQGHRGLDPGVVQIDPDTPLPRLRREGGFVVNRPGRLIAVPDPSTPPQARGELWVFAFDRVAGVDDLRPMIVQKTQRLQMMQDARAGDVSANTETRGRLVGHFLVTGQVHTHRNVNYLLPSAVTARPDAQAAALVDSATAARSAANARAARQQVPSASAVSSRSFESSGGSQPATFAGGDDPIRQMEALLGRPDGAASTPGDPGVGAVAEGINPDGGADAPVVAAPRQEGTYLVERRGRFVGGQAGGAVLFAFAADGSQADDPPVVLMPCGLLEDLENEVRDAAIASEIALSGRVYAHRGVNHVLATSYRTVPRRDNLGN